MDRYHRQRLLPGWGDAGQRRVSAAHAVVVGVGALGCVSADLLARAGVGRLTLIDRDLVDETNLHRQTLFTEADAGARVPKALAAAERLAAVNGDVAIEPIAADLDAGSAERLLLGGPLGRPDVVLDGTDNLETRYLMNDICMKHGLHLIYAGAVALEGAVAPFLRPAADVAETAARDGGHGERRAAPARPCLRCVFPTPPPPGTLPTCDTAGVLGPLVAVVAGYQAALALRTLIDPASVPATMTRFELGPGHGALVRSVDLAGAADPDCPCCRGRVFEFLDRPAGSSAALCGRDAVQLAAPTPAARADLAALERRLAPAGPTRLTRFTLAVELAAETGDGGRPVRLTLFTDGRAIVEGVTDPARARTLYSRYVGA